jgi:hypothetical protein
LCSVYGKHATPGLKEEAKALFSSYPALSYEAFLYSTFSVLHLFGLTEAFECASSSSCIFVSIAIHGIPTAIHGIPTAARLPIL